MKPIAFVLSLNTVLVPVARAAEGAAASGDAAVPAAGGLFSVLFGLIVVIAIIMALAWMARRVGMARQSDNALIQVVGAASLGARERVAVVQVQDAWIVVGISAAGVTSLATLPKGSAPLSPLMDSPAGFAGRLKAMLDAKSKHV